MIRQRLLRQTLTIARRDFVATVFTPLFLVFLLSPLIMIAFGVVGGIGGATLARGSTDRERIAVIAPASDKPALTAADARLRQVFRPDEAPPALEVLTPKGDTAAQARTAMEDHEADTAAVLYGPLDQPHIRYGAHGKRTADYLAALAETVLRDRASGAATALSHPDKAPFERIKPTKSGHSQAAFFAVFGIFFLTLFLSTQAVGTMAEERSNKVIEVLAAAVPLEAVFFGKLLGMFGSALLFVAFWATLVSQVGGILPAQYAGAIGQIGPAVGVPMFFLLFFAYFAMAYLLLGAVFLGAGAQASTPRELQMLSLPITIIQVAMFGLALKAIGAPEAATTRFIELFPLSSPYAMAARAADKPDLWPHVAALGWQALWVAIAITIGARAFRRGVLKSGSGGPLFRRRNPVDMSVS